MTIADQLTSIANTKAAIKSAIEAKGQTVGTAAFDQYPSKIAAITTGVSASGWVRPSDWLSLPSVTSSDNKFVGLLAITDDDSNLIALSASGAFVVDWGDGTIEYYSSAANAQHQYNYANISNSTLCSRGYKQVIVTVTMQSGNSFTSIALNKRHSSIANTVNVNWLDVIIAGPLLSTIALCTSTQVVKLGMVERVQILSMSSALTSFSYQFQNCVSLQEVVLPDTSNILDMSSMFYYCSSIKTVPYFDM